MEKGSKGPGVQGPTILLGISGFQHSRTRVKFPKLGNPIRIDPRSPLTVSSSTPVAAPHSASMEDTGTLDCPGNSKLTLDLVSCAEGAVQKGFAKISDS